MQNERKESRLIQMLPLAGVHIEDDKDRRKYRIGTVQCKPKGHRDTPSGGRKHGVQRA
ncbi:hypothetical protein HYDPIDRAFT_115885 [Hydnomerulius pinastri MD-312]|uniref:Unplaced genomic scaffold scaffold_28, whole genome shotgun sequence n=1 Tax=Hydnomerulius pinastri MD-312 TaxID=994086 RepID=A0A0C9W4K9_9AGAM|nr:hypothetical protein HYDPIDRAFT_115885 [Hydnomerulius pinastri MD-312]